MRADIFRQSVHLASLTASISPEIAVLIINCPAVTSSDQTISYSSLSYIYWLIFSLQILTIAPPYKTLTTKQSLVLLINSLFIDLIMTIISVEVK